MTGNFDVIVVGAGVAGLTAARELTQRRRSVLVLEGRERIGGRTFTIRSEDGAVLEMGAEFVHGGNPAFFRDLKRYGVKIQAVPQVHWLRREGKLMRADDLWDRVGRVMTAIGADKLGRAKGRSVGELWANGKGKVREDDFALARSFIEGFEAAPLERMSAEAMAAIGEEEKQWRVPGGYGRLAAGLAADVLRSGGEIRCGHPVARVRWSRAGVDIDGFTARVVVLTVPLGLEAAIDFAPALAVRRPLRKLELGRVLRVNLIMQPDFWNDRALPAELRGSGGRRFGFVHAELGGHVAFPTWWGRGPAPSLVGWVGGPRADKLVGLTEKELTREAVDSLASVLGAKPARLRLQVKEFATHNWLSDPFARGAYSYARAGWEDAPQRLAKPVAKTIFFAGEATADPAELGTVHGAHASGLRAAKEMLGAL